MSEYETIVKSDTVYLDTSALVKIVKNEGDSSRFVRLMVYGSDLKIFSSWVAYGEFIGIFNKKEEQKSIGLANYLFNCRMIMNDFDYNKIYRIEPSGDGFQFFKLTEDLLSRHAKLGGADIWHLMAAIELKKSYTLSLLLSYDEDLVNAALSENITAVYGNNLIPELLVQRLKSSNRWIPAKS
jgi:hypothetical protein